VTPALTVSKLADQVGMTPDALRYYERTGLLPKPERTASGYRLYDGETADRLRFIKGAQRLGLRLREIRELLEVLVSCVCATSNANWCGSSSASLPRSARARRIGRARRSSSEPGRRQRMDVRSCSCGCDCGCSDDECDC
jgi:DNA-binding transcriptional MerR regulator